MHSYLIDLFIVAVVIGYYFDYKNDKAKYGKKGQSILYLLVIAAIILITLRRLF